MAMIEVEHLQKNFVKTVKEPGLKGALRSFIHPEKQTFEAVKDLTFEVPKGQILGFIGANGAGKSTTIKMLTGILKPTSGFCRINGKIPQDNRQDYVKDIGVVFGQRTQLWWDLALQETYTVLKEIYDVPDSLFHKRMDFLNEVLDLKDFIKDPVRTLSLGQRMRADIAASLLHNPKVLFLDEPTAGMDTTTRQRFWEIINDLKKSGVTILYSSHYIEEVEHTADRILVLHQGRLIRDTTPHAMRSEEKEKQVTLPSRFVPSLDKLAAIYDVTEKRDVVTFMTKDIESVWSSLQAHGCRISDIEIQNKTLLDSLFDSTREDKS